MPLVPERFKGLSPCCVVRWNTNEEFTQELQHFNINGETWSNWSTRKELSGYQLFGSRNARASVKQDGFNAYDLCQLCSTTNKSQCLHWKYTQMTVSCTCDPAHVHPFCSIAWGALCKSFDRCRSVRYGWIKVGMTCSTQAFRCRSFLPHASVVVHSATWISREVSMKGSSLLALVCWGRGKVAWEI